MPDPSRSFQALLCGAGILAATPALADWPHDPLVNVPLHVGAAGVGAPVAVDDGAGGAIVVWEDLHNGNTDLFAQRIAADGTLVWTISRRRRRRRSSARTAPARRTSRGGPNGEPDLAQYRLYRGVSAAFTPVPGNLVVAQSDTGYTDVTAQQWHHKLVAVDVHGNVSAPALVSPGSPTGVGGTVAAGLALAAPGPNPARLEASVRYSLPVAGHVRIALYDLAGREVRLLAAGPAQSGEHTARIALRDDAGRALPAGVYLLRLEAAGRSLTRRMVAVR